MTQGAAILRNVQTGDRGYLVRVNGRDMVRDELFARTFREWPYAKDQWLPDTDVRLLSPFQVAMIAFEADKELCKLSGDPGQAYRDWSLLRPLERIAWKDHGPRGNELRQKVFQAIKAALAEDTQE